MKLIKETGLKETTITRNGKFRRFSHALYECQYCGVVKEYIIGKMKNSELQSCGCRKGEQHNQSNTSLYNIWKAIRQRCRLVTSKAYKYYGERGIDICDEWYDSFLAFKTWAESSGYQSHLTIDRIENDENYCPSNCRWTTRTTQTRNTRKLRSTNTSGYRGVSWSTRDQVWRTTISINSKSIGLGSYHDKLSAAKAYDTYVILNNLEHTINGVLHEPIRLYRKS